MRKITSQKGAILVYFGIVISVLLAIWGLAIGIGFIANTSQRTKIMSNMAALAAIDMFTRAPSALQVSSSNVRSFDDKSNQALAAANTMLDLTNLLSKKVSGEFTLANRDNFRVGEWGQVRLGRWVLNESDCPRAQSSCCVGGKYPCFVQSNDDTEINSAQVEAKSPENAFLAPFAKVANFVNGGSYSTQSTSTALINGRCLAVVLDISDQSVKDNFSYTTERWTTLDNSTGEIIYPDNPAYFAYPYPTPPDCSKSRSKLSLDEKYWCSMQSNSFNLVNFSNDWVTRSTRRGQYLVNLRTLPEPLASNLTALNAGFRDWSRYQNTMDKAILIAYDKEIRYQYPLQGNGATNNLDFFIQLTNTSNIGRIPAPNAPASDRIEPNFISEGLFPVGGELNSGTNLPLALKTAIDRLNSDCAVADEKIIVLAGSGYFNWTYDDNTGAPVQISSYAQGSGTFTYEDTEKQIFNSSDPNSIISRLNRDQIRIIGLPAGQRITPNICNSKDANGKFRTIEDGPKTGVDPLADSYDTTTCEEPADKQLFNLKGEYVLNYLLPGPHADVQCSRAPNDPKVMNACAWAHVGDTEFKTGQNANNTIFRRSNGVVAKLSFLTHGEFCPLMPLENASKNCYQDDNDPRTPNINLCRTDKTTQTKALTGVGYGNQAAMCMREILKVSPSYLVDK